MSKVLTLEEFKEKLEKRINGRPLTVVGPELGVSFQFLSQVRKDVEWPGKKVAAALGYEEVRAYRPIRKPRAKAGTEEKQHKPRAKAGAEEKQHKPRRAAKKRKASAPHKATTARPADDTKRKQWREQKAKQRAARKKTSSSGQEAAAA